MVNPFSFCIALSYIIWLVFGFFSMLRYYFDTKAYVKRMGSRRGLRRRHGEFYRRLAQSRNDNGVATKLKKRSEKKAQTKYIN